MAGFILGTGSGILASAAVYYTLSSSLARSTSALQSESVPLSPSLFRLPTDSNPSSSLHSSSDLLDASFSTTSPPAPSALIGPTHLHQPFADVLRTRWNLAFSRGVTTIANTEWAAIGSTIYDEGRSLVDRVAGTEPGVHPASILPTEPLGRGDLRKDEKIGETTVVEAVKEVTGKRLV
ncbi:MICOS complex subunit MIC12, partial [Tremellales sp. Uapishka_1]